MEILVLSFITLFSSVFIFSYIIEPAYIFFYNRPVYVHLYLFPKQLPSHNQAILEREFSFYRNLSHIKKIYFRHRVQSFIENYEFVGREGFMVTEEVKLRVAATAVMLTFGMRNYLPDVFKAILIYPDIFHSVLSEEYHKGEFNPGAGVIVFSWKHFMEGLEYDNDNLNLGLHEFAHAIHFDSLRRRRVGSSSVVYRDMFEKIMHYVNVPDTMEKLKESHYFRDYAFTNQYEFIAVVLEHYFETPSVFRQNFPQLHEMVGKMINQRI